MTYIPITFDASKQISESDYRKISTDNDIAVSKYLLKTTEYGNPAQTSGLVNTSGADEGKFEYLPLAERTAADVSAKQNIIFLDNSGILTFKSSSGLFPLANNDGRAFIPVVSTLPNPATLPTGFSEIVEHSGALKWYDTSTSTWKTITTS